MRITKLHVITVGFVLLAVAVIATQMAPTRRDTRWADHLSVVDRALQASDVSLAVRAWHDAYGAALASGEWRAMLAVGDAFVGIGRASGSRDGAKANARLAYLTAMSRARRDASVEGSLRAARAFAALGDYEAASQCVQVATRIASERNDRAGLELVREYTGGVRSGS